MIFSIAEIICKRIAGGSWVYDVVLPYDKNYMLKCIPEIAVEKYP